MHRWASWADKTVSLVGEGAVKSGFCGDTNGLQNLYASVRLRTEPRSSRGRTVDLLISDCAEQENFFGKMPECNVHGPGGNWAEVYGAEVAGSIRVH